MPDRTDQPPRILVSRTDRIGDVVLTLPLCGLLKARLGAEVVFLAKGYTRAVLDACPDVDAVTEWNDAAEPAAQRATIAAARAGVVLHVFPRAAVARAAWAARVPRRIGTSRRFYHWLYCNERVALARRASDLHEAQLDVRLARGLLGAGVDAFTPAELAPYARLRPQVPVPHVAAALLGGDRFVLVLHPKSLGSAREWPLAHYAALADALPPERFRVLVTGSAAEGAALRGWLDARPGHVHDLTGRLTLAELVATLARVDGVVAASTGPLHVAAVLGARTLGIYPGVRPMHPGRWAPLGARAEVIEAPGACAACAGAERKTSAACTCLDAVPVAAVRARIDAWHAEWRAEGHAEGARTAHR